MNEKCSELRTRDPSMGERRRKQQMCTEAAAAGSRLDSSKADWRRCWKPNPAEIHSSSHTVRDQEYPTYLLIASTRENCSSKLQETLATSNSLLQRSPTSAVGSFENSQTARVLLGDVATSVPVRVDCVNRLDPSSCKAKQERYMRKTLSKSLSHRVLQIETQET